MWHTPAGDRVLEGNSKELYIHAVSYWFSGLSDGSLHFQRALDEIKNSIENDGGYLHNESLPEVFATMPTEQQVVAVAVVSQALLSPSVPIPELVAWNEATFAAMCECLKIAVEVEIDMHGDADDDEGRRHSTYHRATVLSLYGYEEEEDDEEDYSDLYPDSPECRDMEKWDFLIEQFMDSVLWDRDYEIECLFDSSLVMKTLMGVTEGYTVEIPPIDSNKNYREAVRYLLRLISVEQDRYAKHMGDNS